LVLTTRLLVAGKLPPQLRKVLEQAWDLVERASLPPGPLPGFPIVVTTAMDGVDRALMDELPDLRLIASNGAGTEHLDLAEVKRRGIEVCNTPDAVTRDTADFAIGLLFAVARRIAQSDRFVRSGAWARERMPASHRVSSKRLGIVGLGKIGMAVAERAAALGMQVAYHTRRARPETLFAHMASVQALADWSDFLVLACPGGEETRRLVDSTVLARLGPNGFLINISRGSVVDEAALFDALRNQIIAGAALDVFENEPNIDPAFGTFDNVVLTAHIAAVTDEARADMAEHIRSRIAALLAEGR
jgi:hydroxypyruvate reductase